MGFSKTLKKIFKKILPFLPLILLFTGSFSAGHKLFSFTKEVGVKEFIKQNLFKALIWGYSIYRSLNPKKPPSIGSGDYGNEPVYSWQGASMTAQQTIPVQVVYGDWWVNNANVIDKEITSTKVISPEVTALYLQRQETKHNNGSIVTADNNLLKVYGVTTVEYGDNAGMIIGFDAKKGRYVYYDAVLGWTIFNEKLITCTSPGQSTIVPTQLSNSPGTDINSHYKFVFLPDNNTVMAIKSSDYAGKFLTIIDLTNKVLYSYELFSILKYENGKIFDFNGYQITETNSNIGFYNSIYNTTTSKPDISKSVAGFNCYFHNSQTIRNYTSPTEFTYSNVYTPVDDLRMHKESVDFGTQSFPDGRVYHHSLAFFHTLQFKIIDAVVHYHREYDEYSLQILIEDTMDNFHLNTTTLGKLPGENTYSGQSRAYSNSNMRYVVGLRYDKIETPSYENTTIENRMNHVDNQVYKDLLALGTYGLCSTYTTSSWEPVTKQTEIFNLAYLSFNNYISPSIANLFSENFYDLLSSDIKTNYLSKTRETGQNYSYPIPTFYHTVYRDAYHRIECFSDQGQFSSWGKTDENGYMEVNKSIACIVSSIIMKDIVTPYHVSYSYFSSQCYRDGESRFDPFFVEVANFSFMQPVGATITQDYYGYGQTNNYATTNTTSPKLASTNSFKNLTTAIKNSTITSNLTSILADGTTETFYIAGSNNGEYDGGTYNMIYHTPKNQVVFDSDMDNYLYDFGGDKHFIDFNNILIASRCLYVPEHGYHLVKIDNTFVPIRGWNKKTHWIIAEPMLLRDESQEIWNLNGGMYNECALFYRYGLGNIQASYYPTSHYFFQVHNTIATDNLESGYVQDKDGQISLGSPRILNGKLYWFDSNEIFRNITDSKLESIVSSSFTKSSKIKYIAGGWWNNTNPSAVDALSKTANNVNVTYEPVKSTNGQYMIY